MSAEPRLRVTFVPNQDEDYPWPMTAFLLELDGEEWVTVRYEDGEDADDALRRLEASDERVAGLKVKVPRWRKRAPAVEEGSP